MDEELLNSYRLLVTALLTHGSIAEDDDIAPAIKDFQAFEDEHGEQETLNIILKVQQGLWDMSG